VRHRHRNGLINIHKLQARQESETPSEAAVSRSGLAVNAARCAAMRRVDSQGRPSCRGPRAWSGLLFGKLSASGAFVSSETISRADKTA